MLLEHSDLQHKTRLRACNRVVSFKVDWLALRSLAAPIEAVAELGRSREVHKFGRCFVEKLRLDPEDGGSRNNLVLGKAAIARSYAPFSAP